MRQRYFNFSCGLLGLALMTLPQVAGAQQMTQELKGKDCGMEQQCHWKDFKKICVWVKVCR